MDHAVARLRSILERTKAGKDPEIEEIEDARDEVLARYQPIFSRDHLPELTEEEFRGFLKFKNNRHWKSLQRLSTRVTEDMAALREALMVLLDESEPIENRLRRLRPSDGPPMVKYLGRSIITPVLLVTHPDDYGVLNSVSESGLKELELWPELEPGSEFAERYLAVNEVLQVLASRLEVDLWTLDALWYRVGDERKEDAEPTVDASDEEGEAVRFGLEKHLQEFLFDNWEASVLGQEWELFEKDGEIVGFEYDTREIGRIDLLARHRSAPRWLVVELKRGRSSDRAVGQLLRYRSWVQRNLASDGERVEGMIIAEEAGPKIRYALADLPHAEVVTYSVEFDLHEVEQV